MIKKENESGDDQAWQTEEEEEDLHKDYPDQDWERNKRETP